VEKELRAKRMWKCGKECGKLRETNYVEKNHVEKNYVKKNYVQKNYVKGIV